ncbi:MAG: cell wall-binding repeat-containing protein [Acidimicrobiaceae bacterium]|nr:cell wall-binding repeat-containing protein [Acidimicrobiaceae bacterium]
MRLRWLLFALIGLIASILPMSGVSAAEQPADAGDSAAGAGAQAEAMPDDSAGGVEVLRYAGSDPYKLSIEVAQAVVDAGGGASEWVVLVSGESWIDAATAGPLAASLGAPVVLVPPGGLQTATARPDL